ncbi:unnamed protein product [Ectocarpus sp. CCAP 1310/34]|nr:unnamed protein product [Ectocarpus sp. CCAP 1310/34]
MSRPINADAGQYIPRMIPWRDWDEWYRVKALLFSPEPYLRSQGVQHVAVWQSRERIPHAVETTSQLVEVRLNDAGAAGRGGLTFHGGQRSEEELRLIYSAVVVRAVNGLTGHEQKAAHAAPVSSLAREIGLPTWIVDIRHEAAHKQLPGIVTLRLAADFLVDYLWRRHWSPQAEHLGFVWGAFDQLICRYKATSDSDALMPRSSSPGHAGRPSSKKPRTSSAASGGGSSSNTRDGDSSSKPPGTPRGTGSSAASKFGAAAMEVAAHEIVLSATPTALSWAVVSLLADGGGRVRGEYFVGGVGGTKGRGQGHLLPRSRDKYPTPVRGLGGGWWATLLDMFHSRWRGFGAALLVRLVEALLDNASSTPGAAVNADENGRSACGGGNGSGGDGGGGAGGGGGLERQAAFIEIWVNHLLSRRWHLRTSDARVREALREEAVRAGLSPTFFQAKEALWEENESTWADKPGESPVSVLHAAYFPVHELLDRCRRALSALPAARQPSAANPRTPGDGSLVGKSERSTCPAPPSPSTADGIADDEGKNIGYSAHWARAGLDAVCHALAAALPGENAASPSASAATFGLDAHRKGECDNAAAGAPSGPVVATQVAISANQEVPLCVPPTEECNQTAGPPGEVLNHCSSGGAERGDAAKGPASETAPLLAMMGLDDLERLLGGDASSSLAAPGGYTSVPSSIAAGAVRESGFREVGRPSEVNGDTGRAWELVEAWTPCAIGTLPGSSAARLH